MTKKHLLVTLFLFAILSVCYGFDYWYMDIIVEDFFDGRSSKDSLQRVYFFNDLKTLEKATGFPRHENRNERYSWKWLQVTYNQNSYAAKIYTQMHREGFRAAFVLNGTGTSIDGTSYWCYSVFFISNGVQYYDDMTLYNRPVRL